MNKGATREVICISGSSSDDDSSSIINDSENKDESVMIPQNFEEGMLMPRPELNSDTWICAIDFGTSRTAYGYAQIGKMESIGEVNIGFPEDPMKSDINDDDLKTLTSILLDNEKNVISFGYQVRN